MDEQEAANALQAMRATRGRMAMRAHWSLGRHAAFGAVMGALVASYALPGGWPMLGVAGCALASWAIVAGDRRRDGFFVNGYRRGRTRVLSLALLAMMLVALAAAIALREKGLAWAPLAIGVGLAILGTMASIGWERVYRRELEGADGN
ncbi:hypothetical protein MZO42_12450 [Sphingomonas psychrotolerans]|uniref:Transmembrane protein n=1 Tax=Sphingomonas psychrotolerans TaxID=1327635 RepID=A0ABU3N4P6_9SPHN|nr:hypothetical protein [Sphingomonas psychrotolerans]MDT8759508.1 hypothetical protein [Sphingomonas psychrotolerans]